MTNSMELGTFSSPSTPAIHHIRLEMDEGNHHLVPKSTLENTTDGDF